MSNQYQIVSEALFFSSDNVTHKLNEWKNGTVKSLFIVGFIGSGKTTVSKELSKQYNCPAYSLDSWSQDFVKRHPRDDDDDTLDPRFIKEIEDETKTTKDRIILEGIHGFWIDRKILLNNAIIVMGTSLTTSAFRAWRRNVLLQKEEGYWPDKSSLWLLNYVLKNEMRFYKQINELISQIKSMR